MCYSSTVDIALAYDPIIYYSTEKFIKEKKSIEELVLKIRETDPQNTSIAFLQPNQNYFRVTKDFKIYKTVTEFKREVSRWLHILDDHNHRSESLKRRIFVSRVNDALRHRMEEVYGTTAKVKVLVLVTGNPIPEEILKLIYPKLYSEDVILANFALFHSNDYIKKKTFQTLEYRYFDLNQINEFFDMLREKKELPFKHCLD